MGMTFTEEFKFLLAIRLERLKGSEHVRVTVFHEHNGVQDQLVQGILDPYSQTAKVKWGTRNLHPTLWAALEGPLTTKVAGLPVPKE